MHFFLKKELEYHDIHIWYVSIKEPTPLRNVSGTNTCSLSLVHEMWSITSNPEEE